ncbi:MAG: hypothetical protein QGH90_02735, partial [Candidatus Poseidoniaceae archaeon]|nr:hypothetical protein [Candidatus Poseidoniaceae archaeon]
ESTLGETLISGHERVELANGSHFLSTWNLSGNSTFGLMPSDANESNFITIPLNISANSAFAASQIPNGSLLVTWVNSSGEGGVLTNMQNGNWTMLEAWNSTNSTSAGLSLNQLGNTTYLSLYNDAERGDFHAWWYNNSSLSHIVNQSEVIAITSSDIAGGFIPNGVQAITHRNSEVIANISAFEVYSQSASYLMRTSNGALSFVDHSTFDSTPAQLGISTSAGPFGYAQTSDGGLRIAVYDSLNHDLLVYRLEADSDGDNIPDFDDGLPLVTSQWLDQDGDGWGDNPDGQSPDSCPSDAGNSIFVDFGCPDIDGDGWANTLESAGCNGEIGISFIDRTGCRDWDSDGWSNNGNNWVKGDAYMSNWKQTKESDGDTRGDNHGPDCCDTFHPSTGYTHQSEPDPFPFNFHQWYDTDGDGFGDNFSHESGDQCVYIYGTSEYDRPGCDDSDGDGYSDPVEGVWGVEQGADIWPDDGSQWRDSDGDGHGDNSSDDATNPDKFPNSSIAAIDDDNDGYPDTWTHLYNGSNSTGGLILDACPGVGGYGESFRDRYGCPDSDGDGASDLGDPFPLESSQWQDTDEDGFGDNPAGVLGDICPTIFGFYNGTSGVGCPIINANDDDLDGVINDDDNCPDTPALEVVNFAGCSDSQLDDDLDGVVNSLDSCPDTIGGATVDEIGCSQVQSESDSDDDGVLDPADNCADTVNGSQVDNNGCSAEQRDSDNDGVSDAD